MKKKLLTIGGVILFSLLILVGVVIAFSAGNVDGVWGPIDDVVDCTPTSLYFYKYVYKNRNYNMDRLALAIFNGTGADVDLSDYSVRLYYGTGLDHNTLNLSGTLVDGDVWVLVNSGGAGFVDGENQTFPNNENYQTVVLYKNTTPVDMIGQVNATYTANPAGKQDRTFTRDWVCSGDPDGNTDYDAEWTIQNSATFTGLTTAPTPPEGATCDNYATGGDDTLAGIPTTIKGTWWNQTPPNTDWNQVRYGRYDNCNTSTAGFNAQSGMGFSGVTSIPEGTDFREAFVLGTFCHYNNPISSSNAFGQVDLDVTISGISCEAPLIPGSSTPDEMTFTYRFRLDETPNSYPCTYPSDTGNPCADAIFISQNPDPAVFKCISPGTPPVPVEYTVVVLGFMNRNTDNTCPAWNDNDSVGAFISQEGTSNCACMYGMISDFVPTAVDLLEFTGERTAKGIDLAWQTANEVDNIGFNLYRAESKTGGKVKLNETLIPTNVMPGSLVGAFYSYEDTTVEGGLTYYYWLEDVEAGGKTTLHGPVEVQ